MIGISSLGGFNNYNPRVSPSKMYSQNYSINNLQKLQSILDKQEKLFTANQEKLADYAKTATEFYSGFYSNTGNLKQSSEKLKSFTESSVVNPTGYGSADGTVLSVDKTNSSGAKSYQVEVKQVATADTKTSSALSSVEKGDLAGKSSITIGNNDRSTTLNFNFAANTTNKEALTQMASSINSSKMGVTATVVEKDGKSTLSVASNETGEKNTFSLTATGKADSALKMQETTKAQDASYSVNGEAFTSASNKVSIDNKTADITLKQAGNTTVSAQTVDTGKIVDSVKQFVKDFNSNLDFLSKNASKSSKVANLAYSFGSTRFDSSALSSVGINVDTSGRLSVNEAKLTDTLKNDPKAFKSVVSDYNGIASQVNRKVTSAVTTSQNLLPPLRPTNDYTGAYLYNKFSNNITAQNHSYNSGLLMNMII